MVLSHEQFLKWKFQRQFLVYVPYKIAKKSLSFFMTNKTATIIENIVLFDDSAYA